MEGKLISNKCYYCGSEENSFYAKENGFTLVKCKNCGLLFVNNPPALDEISQAQILGVHGGEKQFEKQGKYEPRKIRRYCTVLEELSIANNLNKINSWLDIGCGYGEFIEAVKIINNKVNIIGNEPNIHKQQSAKRRNLDVSYFDLDNHEEKYDVISLLNVYSHLPDPPVFLEKISRLLVTGGELIIQTGDTANLKKNDHYTPFSLPNHLSFASEEIVVGILEKLGFEIINIKKYSVMQFDIEMIIKEIVKLILPGYVSKMRVLFQGIKTDMFIRAKLKA